MRKHAIKICTYGNLSIEITAIYRISYWYKLTPTNKLQKINTHTFSLKVFFKKKNSRKILLHIKFSNKIKLKANINQLTQFSSLCKIKNKHTYMCVYCLSFLNIVLVCVYVCVVQGRTCIVRDLHQTFHKGTKQQQQQTTKKMRTFKRDRDDDVLLQSIWSRFHEQTF